MGDLNWDRSFALEQTDGDEELLEELIELFISTSLKNLEELKVAVQGEDPSAVILAAHSLKGSSASLGIEAVRVLAMEMEKDARGGSIASAKDNLGEMESLLGQLRLEAL